MVRNHMESRGLEGYSAQREKEREEDRLTRRKERKVWGKGRAEVWREKSKGGGREEKERGKKEGMGR